MLSKWIAFDLDGDMYLLHPEGMVINIADVEEKGIDLDWPTEKIWEALERD